MKHIVCGMGEAGSALANVIRERGEDVEGCDPQKGIEPASDRYDTLHICFPWSSSFIGLVKAYQEKYSPTIAIIHSTVPVGTTRKIGGHIAHSPVHGVHPDLEYGIKTFIKPVGGLCEKSTHLAQHVFDTLDILNAKWSSPEATEFSKIMCTTQYAWNVILCKEIAAECERLGVPFSEVYSLWNYEYNRGYVELDKPEVCRPNLTPMPGPIGGHCLIPNAKLYDCWLTETILKRNEDYK